MAAVLVSAACAPSEDSYDVLYPFEGCEAEARLLNDSPVEGRRFRAAWRLEGCPEDVAVPALLNAFANEPVEDVILQIAISLSRIVESEKPLLQSLKFPRRPYERYYAVLALPPNPPLSLDWLLVDPDPDVRLYYSYKLVGYRKDDFRKAVASERDPEVKRKMAIYLDRKDPLQRKRREIDEILRREREQRVRNSGA